MDTEVRCGASLRERRRESIAAAPYLPTWVRCGRSQMKVADGEKLEHGIRFLWGFAPAYGSIATGLSLK